MKTTFITVAFFIIATGASAQTVKEAEVPGPVLSSFGSHFKGAKAEKWEKEKDGNYEAEFDWNKTETSATFSAAGQLLETETELKTSALPKAITEYVSKNYAGYKLEEAAKITDAGNKVSYEAEVKKGKEGFDLIFDANGNFVRKEAKQVEEKENDKK